MIYLPDKAPADVLREAEKARKNRLEIVQALSHGQISRRDLLRWGLVSATGVLAAKHGLNPFVSRAWAASGSGTGIPTGVPPSPLFGALAFSQPMPRMDGLPRKPVSSLTLAPTA